MSSTPQLRDSGNQLLDRLTKDDYELLLPRFQNVSLSLRQVVHQFEDEVSYIYFPTTALFSFLTVLEEDDPVETATVGKEGFVGLTVPLGVLASPHRVMCQMNGDSLRLSVRSFLEALEQSPELKTLVNHYVVFSMRSISQTIACNALHSAEARAARWLLMVHDQAGQDEFPMTHEFLAYMLGVRRQTVTVVAGTLQNAGLIGYRRGTILIKDRERLEEAACECYGAVRKY